ncbi:transposase [Streptomyces sp. A0592]|uniref:transposase n=1 Tax=Streptomyces sp. A0592 TaxID=2563099 RepID=UPI001F0DB5FE|nr:transposase [Streptomyces sp. A0592]
MVWRKGSKAALSSHFVLLRVRLAGRRPKPADDGTIPLAWLIAQWPEGEDEPVKYWVSNLPANIPAKGLVRLAKSRWRIEHDHRELKTALGLDHLEGRSFTGWHRHVTLVTAAHLFLTEQRSSPKVPARTAGPAAEAGTAEGAGSQKPPSSLPTASARQSVLRRVGQPQCCNRL